MKKTISKSIVVRPKRMAVTALKHPESLYEKDFCAWSIQQSNLIRKGDFDHIDIDNIAEEIESLSRTDRRSLLSHLIVLLLHLLKCEYQPSKRSKSWNNSINEARRQIEFILMDSPSLKRELPIFIANAYSYACKDAHRQTGIDLKKFPKECPWTKDVILNDTN